MKDIPLFVSIKEECIPVGLRGDKAEMKNLQSCRIPSLCVSENTVVAACDRAGFGGDWGFIEIAVRLSEDSGKTFGEMKTIFSPPCRKAPEVCDDDTSAFAIDPVMVKAKNGELIMLFDFYPECKGLFKRDILVNSNGYVTDNGRFYLRLHDRSGNEYTVRENGIVYDCNGNRTNYYLPAVHSADCNYQTVGDLYYSEGEPEYIGKCPPLIPENGKDKYVGNIFLRWQEDDPAGEAGKKYSERVDFRCLETTAAPLTADTTSYIWMMKSFDNGKTWSQPKDITPYIKTCNDDVFLGVGPGCGVCLDSGRLLMPIYSVGKAFVIYSDDNGDTWRRVMDCENIDECQFVVYGDGTVGCFGRPTVPGNMPYSVSEDGGITWKSLPNRLYTVRCQHSCLNVPISLYDENMDKDLDYILLARPTGHFGADQTRTCGCVALGEVHHDHTIEWISEIKIKTDSVYETSDEYHDFFAYSCMAALPDGRIGILYEPFPSGYVAFSSFEIGDFFC